MTRLAAAGGGHGDREFLLVHGARFMLASSRFWFAVLPANQPRARVSGHQGGGAR